MSTRSRCDGGRPATQRAREGEDDAGLQPRSTDLADTLRRRHRPRPAGRARDGAKRSEEHTSELQSLMRNSYAVFCLKKKNKHAKTLQHEKTEQKITVKAARGYNTQKSATHQMSYDM